MNAFLIIILIALMAAVVYSLVRGIVAFMQSTKMDLESEDDGRATAMQLRQNKMMFNRIMFQAAAIVVVAIILAANG